MLEGQTNGLQRIPKYVMSDQSQPESYTYCFVRSSTITYHLKGIKRAREINVSCLGSMMLNKTALKYTTNVHPLTWLCQNSLNNVYLIKIRSCRCLFVDTANCSWNVRRDLLCRYCVWQWSITVSYHWPYVTRVLYNTVRKELFCT